MVTGLFPGNGGHGHKSYKQAVYVHVNYNVLVTKVNKVGVFSAIRTIHGVYNGFG